MLAINAEDVKSMNLVFLRWWWQDMPMKDELNRLLILPNTEHIEITGMFEELPAAIAWVNFLN